MKSRDVIDFMARDLSNPSSIMSCLRAARENTRAVRSSTNSELWESLNTTWLDAQRLLADGMLTRPLRIPRMGQVPLAPVARRASGHAREEDDAFWFMRLGTFIERADNTARILDVKFEMLETARRHVRPAVRLLPLDRRVAFRVGLRGVPQGVSRRHHAGARRGPPDPVR